MRCLRQLSMDARLAAERELFSQLDIQQLEELAAESQALVDRAMAMVKANSRETRMIVGASAVSPGGVDDGATGEVAEQPVGLDGERGFAAVLRS